MVAKYTGEDVGKQKFIIENFYLWEMIDDKDIKAQINKYHRFFENINLFEAFIAGILMKKFLNS